MTDESSEKQCFFITPIGAVGSDTRLRSDQILRHVVKPAAQECGYLTTRADEIDSSGMISTQVLERILGDELVIADLTDQNPNVFYELVVRHATRKPFIQIIAAGQSIPFDVQGIRTIELDHRDLDSASAARESIVRAVRSINDGTPVDTPMTYTLDLQDLRGSGKAEERGVVDILEVVQTIQRQLKRSSSEWHLRDLMHFRDVVERWTHQGILDKEDLALLLERKSGEMNQWLRPILERARPAPTPSSPMVYSDEPPFLGTRRAECPEGNASFRITMKMKSR